MKWVLFSLLLVVGGLVVFSDAPTTKGPAVGIVEEVAARSGEDSRVPICTAHVRLCDGKTKWVVSDVRLTKGDVVEFSNAYHPRIHGSVALVRRIISPDSRPTPAPRIFALPNPIPIPFF